MTSAAETVRSVMERVAAYRTGAAVACTVVLGDRLGLYRALADGVPADASSLARRTGLKRRWVLEWLLSQAAAGFVEHLGGDRFQMPEAVAAVLADEDSLSSLVGLFASVPAHVRAVERLSRRSPGPVPADEVAEEVRATARMREAWVRGILVECIVPQLDGVEDRLRGGARVADVGCGAGLAAIELARAYPACEVHAYDLRSAAVGEVAERCRAAGLGNVRAAVADAADLPAGGPFDLVLTLDCMHEMSHPAAVAASIRRVLAGDGTWLVEDFRAEPTAEQNLARGPLAAMLYATSVLVCLPEGLSAPDAAGLGALGFSEEVAGQVARAAGFTRFRSLELGSPTYAHYEIRP